MAEAMVRGKVSYKAFFERTDGQNVNGKSRVVMSKFENPDDPEFVALAKSGKRGYLTITDLDGTLIHGMDTSGTNAVAVMKSIIAGTYNPFPKVRNVKKEVV